MKDLDSQIAALQKELQETPRHKATEHHLGRLKARLAKLKKQVYQQSKSAGRTGFLPKKTGDATIILLGPPSVGKSTLLNQLTGAHSRVESWPFSTLKVIPGMLLYQGAQIQIFDLPGVIDKAAKGVGRGREVLAAAQVADLLLLMVDLKTRSKAASILAEIKKLAITKPVLVVVNKTDLLTEPSVLSKKKNWLFISAEKKIGLEELKKRIWQELKLLRVYLKPHWAEADLTKPLILKKGQTVAAVAAQIFPEKDKFKQILLWGSSARFPGQEVSLTHKLKDEDVLSFIN